MQVVGAFFILRKSPIQDEMQTMQTQNDCRIFRLLILLQSFEKDT